MQPDYKFYTEMYYGNQITEADFPRLIARSAAYLSNMCSLQNAPDEAVKMALCAVAEAWQTNEQGGDIVSQSVGNWSKSYAQKKVKTDEQRLSDAAKLYLGQYCNLTVRWV